MEACRIEMFKIKKIINNIYLDKNLFEFDGAVFLDIVLTATHP